MKFNRSEMFKRVAFRLMLDDPLITGDEILSILVDTFGDMNYEEFEALKKSFIKEVNIYWQASK